MKIECILEMQESTQGKVASTCSPSTVHVCTVGI